MAAASFFQFNKMSSCEKSQKKREQISEKIFYYLDHNTEGNPNVGDFLEKEFDFVLQNTQTSDDYKSKWCNYFREACYARNIAFQLGKPIWGRLDKAFLPAGVTTDNSPYCPESASSTNTPNNNKLTTDDKKNISASYSSLKSPKWKLKCSGKIVEDCMKIVAEQGENEHPVHSMILDPTDPEWRNHFTEEELNEIRTHNMPEIPDLPNDLQEFINGFEGMVDLDQIYEHACSYNFHPKKEPMLHWMHQSIIQALGLLFSRYLDKSRSETDLIRRVWFFLDSVFDFSEDVVVNSGERASKATSEGENKDRSIGALEATSRKKIGTKVDLLYSTPLFEVGAMEASAVSDRSSTKSMTELNLKCPKTLKAQLVEMERKNATQINNIKNCGFVLSGLYLQFVIADCPQGHVCRITKLPDYLPYPVSAGSFVSEFSALLHVAWCSSRVMHDTKKLVETKVVNKKPSFSTAAEPRLTPCFIHTSSKPSSRKRRRNIGESATSSATPLSS